MSSGKMLRGQGKFFRPNEQFDDESSDDDDDEDEEDDEEEDQPAPTRKPTSNIDEDDDDDDDDDLEDDDDDEEEIDTKKKRRASGGGGGSQKKSKPSSSIFFDVEADDDGDQEEDEEPYGTHHDPHDVVKKFYTAEDIRREQMDDEARELIRQQDRRRKRAGRFGGDNDDDSVAVAAMARDIENRHRMERRVVGRRSYADRVPIAQDTAEESSGSVHHGAYTAVSQQSLIPSVSDPSMWMINCSNGKEEEMVYQIMNKCIAYAKQNRPLGITGAIAAQSKGRIYIESYQEPAVMEAIQGIRGLLPYSMRLIPINDRTNVMTVKPSKVPVKENEWVRLQRGQYKGDLALVKLVRDSGQKCVVQFVPRLDLTLSRLSQEKARIRRRTVKPPQKFFNLEEVAAVGAGNATRTRFPGQDIQCDFYDGNYYHDGYQLKEMAVGTMIKKISAENPPTLEELQNFRRTKKNISKTDDDISYEENDGSKLAGSLLDELSEIQGKTGLTKLQKAAGGGLLVGDVVEVVEGDLIGLRGKLLTLDGSTVKIKPTTTKLDLPEEVEFLATQVRKYIAVGAHVKVMDGRYANETGNVVAVEKIEGETDCTAVLLTDVTNKEITVRTSQLRETSEVATALDKLAGYELYDLVVLSGGGSSNEVGVIVRVGREDFTVINNHGIIREVRPEELRGKKNQASNRAIAVDVQGNQIRVGDQVSVTEGPHKGKQATIKRMSRTQLFLYSQTRTDNAGIFVVRSRSCMLSGSRTQRGSGQGDPGASPVTPRGQPGGGAGGRKREDALIGKSVRIQAGQWKGYIGTVADATATHVQVELHSRLKKVMVVRERVVVAGDKYGSTEDPSRNNQQPSNEMTPSTPFIAGRATPMHGGATPMHGGATPMHDNGGEDAVWRPGGALDQDNNTNDDDDGWGSNSNDQANPFGSTDADGDGWGSSSNSTWTPSATNENGQSSQPLTGSQPAVKEENSTSIPTQVKRETIEADSMDGDGEETPVWFLDRVCVKLKNDQSDGVIREVTGKSATVEVNGGTKSLRASEITMIEPKEHDIVLVTGGADVGVEGELVCIDGTDAILKDANEDFKIVDFVHLAKIASDT
eukprot:CAMPEP_0178917180 /NCGR_PEP_ID=MMETSP0786-20121207/13100_1 /TAXON_ID=186022 /ORGANISM="Thalassionema frauenfeldii, Strain CCMP 1798" /LENGTH=1094 /DNA_ID=CAMNT_0020590695 /DNA_START=80 /DNA_END=3364 /DNA_ORIENTATION=-